VSARDAARAVDIPFERWHKAVAARTSRRVYDGRMPSEELLAPLETVCDGFRPFPGARTVLVRESPEPVFKGLIGGYGKVKGAPLYAAFIADTPAAHCREAVGYIGEAFVLEATALGLGTCWVSGFFRPGRAAAHVPLKEGESILAVTPVGFAVEGLTFIEKRMKAFVKAERRKPMEELVVSGSFEEPWQRAAVEAARLAPSAVNRQPWRFRLEPGAVGLEFDKSAPGNAEAKRLDCGIAMLHVELGARSEGVDGSWEFLDAPGVAVFRSRRVS
jgi:hypothetical protein